MNPDNAIIGDSSGVDLPEMTPDTNLLVEEKKMAKYRKTAEFKRITDHFKQRIEFYQSYLPDGRPIATQAPSPEQWVVANAIIAEFNQVINMFDEAKEAVDVLSSPGQ